MTRASGRRQYGTVGRRKKSSEPRVLIATRLPESIADRISRVAEGADINNSDLVGYCTIQALNQMLSERGEEPIEMPGYLQVQEPAIRQHPVPPSQEALMAG